MTDSKYFEQTLRLAPAAALDVKVVTEAGTFEGY